MHSPWKLILIAKTSHPSNEEVVHYNLYWIAQIHELIVDNLNTFKEPIRKHFYFEDFRF